MFTRVDRDVCDSYRGPIDPPAAWEATRLICMQCNAVPAVAEYILASLTYANDIIGNLLSKVVMPLNASREEQKKILLVTLVRVANCLVKCCS